MIPNVNYHFSITKGNGYTIICPNCYKFLNEDSNRLIILGRNTQKIQDTVFQPPCKRLERTSILHEVWFSVQGILDKFQNYKIMCTS